MLGFSPLNKRIDQNKKSLYFDITKSADNWINISRSLR